MLSGISINGICETLNLKKPPFYLDLYLFCCPTFDMNLRMLPKDGGYYDQDFVDMYHFRIIESRIIDYQIRHAKK